MDRSGNSQDSGWEPPTVVGAPAIPQVFEGAIAEEDAPGPDDARAALDALMRRHRVTVYRYCRRMFGNDADASDASQTVFLQAFEALKQGVEVQNERAWLLGIARNRCLDRLRRHSFVVVDQEELERAFDRNRQGIPVMPDPPASQAIEDCLDTLDPRSRAVLLLRFHDDLSYEQISALTGDTPGALRVRVARALPSLRRCLELKGVTL